MKRIGISLFVFLLVFVFTFSACAKETTLLTTVPSEHTISVTCARGGSILYDGQTYTGTVTLIVPRFGAVSFKAVPDRGCRFSRLITNSESGISIVNNEINITNLFEDKTINLRFACESKDDSELENSKKGAENALYQKDLGADNSCFTGSIVLDEYDSRQNYEWLSILRHSDTAVDNRIMICADATEAGAVEHRRLVMSFAQLDRLYNEHEFTALMFRNGNVVVMLELEDIFSNSICKLIERMENNETIESPALEIDETEEVIRSYDQLEKAYIDIHIIPSEVSGSSIVFNLDVNQQKVDITSLLPSFNIGFDIPDVDENNPECEYAVMRLNEGEENEYLPSALTQAPSAVEENYEERIEYFHVIFSDPKAPPMIVYEENIRLDRYTNEIVYAHCLDAGMYRIVCMQCDVDTVEGSVN